MITGTRPQKKGQKWLKPLHRSKANLVLCGTTEHLNHEVWPHTPHCWASNSWSMAPHTTLLSIQLMKYGPTHHTIIWFSLKLSSWRYTWMHYFHGNYIVNIACFDDIIWSFLWENTHDCNVTMVMHDVTMLLFGTT